jgi:hypothetical protein
MRGVFRLMLFVFLISLPIDLRAQDSVRVIPGHVESKEPREVETQIVVLLTDARSPIEADSIVSIAAAHGI